MLSNYYLLCCTGTFLMLLHYCVCHTSVWMNSRFHREFSFCLHHDHNYTYCICITLFLILPNSKRDALVSLHGDGARDGISAFCTTSCIELPDMSIKQIMQIHFRHISTSGFLPNQCIYTSCISYCFVTLLSIDIGQHMSKHLFFTV